MAANPIYIGGSFSRVTRDLPNNAFTYSDLFALKLDTLEITNVRNLDFNTNNQVRAIYSSPSSPGIVIGGTFTTVGSNPTTSAVGLAAANSSSPKLDKTPLMSGDVFAITPANDGTNGMYIGGSFTNAAGDVNADRLAYWDGVNTGTMRAVDNAQPFNTDVWALAMLGNDDLFVGVQGTGITSAGANYIAKYTRSTKQWNRLANNALNNDVRAIAIRDANTIIVGGDFSNVDGDYLLDYIAVYNNATDTFRRLANCEGPTSSVYTLVLNGSSLFIGGSFGALTDVPGSNYIVRYDFNTNRYHRLGGRRGDYAGVGGTVQAIAVQGDNVIVAGAFQTTPGNQAMPVGPVAIWNARTGVWRYVTRDDRIPSGTAYALDMYDANTVLVGGGISQSDPDYTHRYLAGVDANDNIQSVLTGNIGSTVWAINDIHNNLFVAGQGSSMGVQTYYLQRHTQDGVSTPYNHAYTTNTVYTLYHDTANNDLYVGGSFGQLGYCSRCQRVGVIDLDTNNVYALDSYNGRNGNDTLNSNVRAIHVGMYNGNKAVFLGGDFTTTRYTRNSYQRSRFAIMDMVTQRFVDQDYYFSSAVHAMTPSPANANDLFIGGAFTETGRVYSKEIVLYNRATSMFESMFPDSSYGPNNLMLADAIMGDVWYIGGQFSNDVANIYGTRYLFAYDMANRQVQALQPSIGNNGVVFNTVVRALLADNGRLYVGGDFSNADNQGNADNFVYYVPADGTWHAPTTSPLNARVRALAKLNSEIIILGGDFTNHGAYITSYNVTSQTFSALANSTLNNDVRTLAVKGNLIYAGGDFTSTGTVPASYVAVYDWSVNAWSYLQAAVNPNNYVTSIALVGNDVYLGGAFTNLNGDGNADYFARFSAGTFSAAGGVAGANSVVWHIKPVGDKLMIGGSFSSIGSNGNRNYLAEYDTTAGAYTDRFLTNSNQQRSGANNPVYWIGYHAAKNFLTITSNSDTGSNALSCRYLAYYNSTTGQINCLPNGVAEPNNDVFTLATAGSHVYVGGAFSTPYARVARYTPGTQTWANVTYSDFNSNVRAILIDGSDMWLGGDFTMYGGIPSTYLARVQLNPPSGTAQVARFQGINGPVYALAKAGPAGLCSIPNQLLTPFCSVDYPTTALSAQHRSLDLAAKADYDARVAEGKSSDCLAAYKAYVCGTRFPSCFANTTNGAAPLCQSVCSASNTACSRSDSCASLPTSNCMPARTKRNAISPRAPVPNQKVTRCVPVDPKQGAFCASTLGADHRVSAAIAQGEANNRAAGHTHASTTTCEGCAAAAKEYFCHKFFPTCDNQDAAKPLCKSQCDNWASSCGVPAADLCDASMPTVACVSGKVSARSSCSVNGHPFANPTKELFIAGSISQSNARDLSGPSITTEKIVCYNETTNKWSDVPCRLSGGQVYDMVPTADGKRLILVGSFNAQQANAYGLVEYDPATGDLTTLTQPNNQIHSVQRFGDELYLGGFFTNMGTSAGDYIAKYNLTAKAYEPLFTSNTLNGAVYSVRRSSTKPNIVYAGGDFTDRFTVIDTNNATVPRKQPVVFNNRVKAIAQVPGTELLYLGGEFTYADTFTANRFAIFDLASDKFIDRGFGGAVEGNLNNDVRTLCVQGNDVYLGGGFTGYTGLSADYLLRYHTGNKLMYDLGSGPSASSSWVYSCNTQNGSEYIYFGGSGNSWDGVTSQRIVRFKNSTQDFVSLDGNLFLGSTVYSILVDGPRLVAGLSGSNSDDYYYLAQWSQGADRWHGVGGGFSSTVNAAELVGDTLHVGGSFNSFYNDQDTSEVVMYDPQENGWQEYSQRITTGGAMNLYVAITMGEDLFVAGSMSSLTNVSPRFNIARIRNGNTYQLRQGVDGTVRALATHGSSLYVGGQHRTVGGIIPAVRGGDYVVVWDGNNFGPLARSSSVWLSASVRSLLVVNDDLYIGCDSTACVQYTDPATKRVSYYQMVRYNIGTGGWIPYGPALEDPENAIATYQMAEYAGTVYMATNRGVYSTSVNQRSLDVAFCVDGGVYTLLIHNNYLFIGGDFASAGVSGTEGVARIDLTTGTVEAIEGGGTRTDYTIYHLTLHRGEVWAAHDGSYPTMIFDPSSLRLKKDSPYTYQGFNYFIEYNNRLMALSQGTFTDAKPANRLATVNMVTGETQAIGNGTSSTVQVMLRYGDDIYVGGSFYEASDFGDESSYLIKYNVNDKILRPAYNRLRDGTDTYGLSSTVNAMVRVGNSIILGGSFADVPRMGISQYVTRFNPASGTFSPLGVSQELNSNVYALAVHNGLLYVGGSFTQVSQRASRFVEFNSDTDKIRSLGIGFGASGTVHDVVVDPNNANHVYLTGSFSSVDSLAVSNIARYNRDSNSYSVLADRYGLTSTGYQLHVTATDVYVATQATIAINAPTGNVANDLLPISAVARYNKAQNKWFGIKPEELRLDGGSTAVTRALIDGHQTLCVAGSFTNGNQGRVTITNMAPFNRTTGYFENIGSFSGPNSRVYAIGGSANGNLAGGQFSSANVANTERLAAFNGTYFTGRKYARQFSSDVRAIETFMGQTLVGGNFYNVDLIMSRFGAVRGDFVLEAFACARVNGNVYAIAVNGTTDVYIGGSFTSVAGQPMYRVAHYDAVAKKWMPLTESPFQRIDNDVFALEVVGDDVYMGGSFAGFDQITSPAQRVAHFHPSNFSSSGVLRTIAVQQGSNQFSTSSGHYLYAMEATRDGKWVYVGHTQTSVVDNNGHYLVRFDPATEIWESVYTGAGTNLNSNVRTVREHPTTRHIWVGGYFLHNVRYIDPMNNRGYISPTGLSAPGAVFALEFYKDLVFMGGTSGFRYYNTTSQTTTTTVGGLTFSSGNVLAMTRVGTSKLLIGGSFTLPARYLVLYDMDTDKFKRLSAEPNNQVSCFAKDGDDVYVGGYFSTLGDFSLRNTAYLVRWNSVTDTFTSVAGGLDNYVETVAVYEGNVFVGGGMTRAYNGQTLQSYYALYAPNRGASGWEPADYGLNSFVLSSTVVPGRGVYAGGRYYYKYADPSNRHLMRWNRATGAIGGLGDRDRTMDSTVYALKMIDSDTLLVGGQFTSCYGNSQCDYLLSVDTKTAKPRRMFVGSSSQVYAIARSDTGEMVFGGNQEPANLMPNSPSYGADNIQTILESPAQISGDVRAMKYMARCQAFPSTGFCADTVTWPIGYTSASLADWNKEAENRYGGRVDLNTTLCANKMKIFACASAFPACHGEYGALPVCRSACEAAARACNGTSFACSNLPETGCHPQVTVEDPEPVPEGPRGLTVGEIIAIVFGALIFVGGVAAVVAYYNHPPFKMWVDTQAAAFKKWWASTRSGGSVAPTTGGDK